MHLESEKTMSHSLKHVQCRCGKCQLTQAPSERRDRSAHSTLVDVQSVAQGGLHTDASPTPSRQPGNDGARFWLQRQARLGRKGSWGAVSENDASGFYFFNVRCLAEQAGLGHAESRDGASYLETTPWGEAAAWRHLASMLCMCACIRMFVS